MKIKTEHAFPPIPIRRFDWIAYDDDTYGGPGSITGMGETEEEAIEDFREQWEDRYGEGTSYDADLRS
jgi:hypothetical protein